MDVPDKIIKGETADAVYLEIVKLVLAVEPTHLAYFGKRVG